MNRLYKSVNLLIDETYYLLEMRTRAYEIICSKASSGDVEHLLLERGNVRGCKSLSHKDFVSLTKEIEGSKKTNCLNLLMVK